MKALVTGGLGLIGHHVVRKLVEDHNVQVSIYDNLTNYNGAVNMKELGYLYGERMKTITALPSNMVSTNYLHKDINDLKFVQSSMAFMKPDVVYHLAMPPRQKVVSHDPAGAANTMMGGLLNMLQVSVENNVKRFVYVSSSMVYGEFKDNVKEDAVLNPQGEYGIMKMAGELLVKDYCRKYGLEYTILRPSAVYGPNDVGDRVIAKFLLSAMGGGTLNVNGEHETLDFTYVEDAAEGFVQAGLSPNAANKTYNITKSHSKTILEAANNIVAMVGKGEVNVREKDADFPSRGALDITAARNDFGYDPKVDIEEGFQIYYDWLQDSVYWDKKTIQKFIK